MRSEHEFEPRWSETYDVAIAALFILLMLIVTALVFLLA